jgi:hypothetical protein
MGTAQDAVQNVVAFFQLICAGLQAVTTGHITQYSRFLLEKLTAAFFFEEIPRPLWKPEAEVYSLLGHDLVLIGNLLPTFCRNLLPPSSWSGSIPRQTNFYRRRHGISNHTSLMPQPVIRTHANGHQWIISYAQMRTVHRTFGTFSCYSWRITNLRQSMSFSWFE